MAKWDKEAADVEPSWIGGPDYIKFCQGMAGAAREKQAELEAELKHLQGNDSAARQEGESTMSDQSHDLQAHHPNWQRGS